MLAIVAAMETEVRGILRHGKWSEDAAAGLRAWRRDEVPAGTTLVALCGVGREAAAPAAKQLLARTRPAALVSLGFAGGLQSGLRAGDLVIATSLVVPSVGAIHELPLPTVRDERAIAPDAMLAQMAIKVAEKLGLRYQSGGWLTVDSAVCSAAEKHRLAQETGAVAVEMESYWLAEAAREADVPFVAVRAVLDGARSGLPEVVRGTEGEAAALKVLARAVRSPGSLPALFGLGRAMLVARRSLTRFVVAFVEEFARRPVAAAQE